MELIFFLGAIQSFFWVLLILNKKKKQLPDFILATWLFIVGINIFLVYIQFTPYNYKWWPWALGINGPIPMLHGPFLLLYIQSQQKKFDRIKPVHFLHGIPALIGYLVFTEQFLMSKEDLIYWIENEADKGPSWNLIVNEILISSVGVCYIIWCWIELKRHQKKIGQFYSYLQDVSLHWLRNLIIGLGIIWFIVIFSEYLFWFIKWRGELFSTASALIYIAASLFVFYIGFYGIKQGVIFFHQSPEAIEKVAHSEKLKYERSGLKKENAEHLADQLLVFMKKEKPYLESKLTLSDLAERFSVPQNHLSQVINDQIGSNFYEFINTYRVEEFKHRVVNSKKVNYTILGHALESGFSSKSSFNEIFKKKEGITPSEFLKAHK